jgi:hypothetical protein
MDLSDAAVIQITDDVLLGVVRLLESSASFFRCDSDRQRFGLALGYVGVGRRQAMRSRKGVWSFHRQSLAS